MTGALLSIGVRVQQVRIRESMRRVNPDCHFIAELKDSKLRGFKLHTIHPSEKYPTK